MAQSKVKILQYYREIPDNFHHEQALGNIGEQEEASDNAFNCHVCALLYMKKEQNEPFWALEPTTISHVLCSLYHPHSLHIFCRYLTIITTLNSLF